MRAPSLPPGRVAHLAITPPDAEKFFASLRESLRDVTDHPVYARDIDPALRGPFGVCTIELKEGAKPMAKKFFRCIGER